MKLIIEKLFRFAHHLAVAIVLVLIAVIAANIVFREALGIALVWANEVAVSLFVWSAFIGAGIAFGQNARIRFTFVTDRLPRFANTAFEVLVTYVGLVLLLGLLATSIYVMYIHRNETFTTMPISVVWEWAAVPVGALLCVVGWLRNGQWTFSQARAALDTRAGSVG